MHASADDFLAGYDIARPGCLVLDVRMPGMSGLEAQRLLAARGCPLPVVIVTPSPVTATISPLRFKASTTSIFCSALTRAKITSGLSSTVWSWARVIRRSDSPRTTRGL